MFVKIQIIVQEEVFMEDYIIEMLNITKEFPGIVANDNM